jgi:hypothetical protein
MWVIESLVGHEPKVSPYARDHEAFHDCGSSIGLPLSSGS